MKLTYDAKSFILDGKRIWITAGEIHYFRHPRSEWRQALLRAKRAGLNAVSTYVPWNFHELQQGETDFEGDKDLGAYIDLIGEMGMYAMLRPGPYICSEWDGGGIPAWLCAMPEPVRRFREDDPVYMAAVESWFDMLLPIISERQITRGGGPVITIQNENEYPGGWDASMRRYIGKLNGMFRKHGIDVPVLACNVHGASKTACKINDSTEEQDQFLDPGMILTYNHHVVVEPVYDLKSKQPDKPLFITEFWCGEPIYWGKNIRVWPTGAAQAKAAYEYASAATQIVYYMFDGGTNFGFWAGHNIATSYASSYPVGEGGLLTEKYYTVRPANLFASQFGHFLAGSEEVAGKAGIRCPEGVRLVVRDGSKGSMVFLSAADRREEIPVALPDGRGLTVQLGEVAAAVLPVALKVADHAVVDYSNLTLLAWSEARNALILYGPAGTEGVVSINGQELHIPIRLRKVEFRDAGGIVVLAVDEEMARRCWITGDRILFGPDYVAEDNADGSLEVKVSEASPDIVELDRNGYPVQGMIRYEAASGATPIQPPELGAWRMAPCEIVQTEQANGWVNLANPCSHEQLGVVQGYVWYGAELVCEEEGVTTLLLTNTPNRVSVFVNGEYSGTHAARRHIIGMRDDYAHPADWAFEELTVRVRKGLNRFTFLSDSLGHNYDVPVPEGIQGPVFAGSRRLDITGLREVSSSPVSEDAFYFMYNRHYREPAPLPAWEFELTLDEGERAFISIHGVQCWVTMDGEDVRPMSFPESPWTMFPQIKRFISWQLPEQAAGRTTTVRVQYVGSNPHAIKEHMTVYAVPKSGECSNWRWKPWEPSGDLSSAHQVEGTEAEKEGQVVLLPVGSRLLRKGRQLTPASFETQFPMPDGERPVYLKIGEMQKGQIFLNGHNIGRFWRHGGTQELYYLPRSLMKEENRLIIFEELGLYPQSAALVFGEQGRWNGVRVP